MTDQSQSQLLSTVNDVDVFRVLLADLHDDLTGKVARFRQLADLSAALGSSGTMMPGGETVLAAWTEARSSFVHGNYVATVLLCQGLAEHMLAAHLTLRLDAEELPSRVSFNDTLQRCVARDVITQRDADDLRRLMHLRNPLTHYRSIDDPSNLDRRMLDTRLPAETHLLTDATFAMSMAIRLLALPAFRLGD
ncbi:hypothetical protein [Burkholderia pseudomallei]|uniref:hypothetical protein n=1 Tax=Burkholderia pseudomallei TaxID=28450 RepID=UPI0005728DF2|nr:hypothetical protein [Burkholderia pseudomallei]KYZ79192.1 hypothetical protein PTBPS01_02505 [Burkholderia pseudomallei]MBF3383764.1 hypothetical protein [Burkholderia pseudomallei]MBF3407971.1 hypothetical protein [Burkholderia pseudomallei]MBF3414583.1 hypothetical protein [Burkholderia pseudomallei]MBF3443435.1 hypothetical protein [Burkholderia pseudomallei]